MNYIFDIDGTLTKDYSTTELLPNVGEFFRKGDYERIGFASNQGGVGLRYWMETWDSIPGNITDYPTEGEARRRAWAILSQITLGEGYPDLRVNGWPLTAQPTFSYNLKLAFAYRSKKGEWSPSPPEPKTTSFWRRDWRKPAPGMLLDLIEYWGAKVGDVTMVGDRPEDLAAALNAGCLFAWAHDFFGFVPEMIWLDGSNPHLAPENLVFPTGDDLEGVTMVYPPVRYYRLANSPPNLEVIELDEAQFPSPDASGKFKAVMDNIVENE